MKNKDFYDEHHAASYLSNSIIRKGIRPIYILDVREADKIGKKWRINYSFLGKDEQNILFLPHKDIDMNPVSLGMMNYENGSYFVSRSPNRGWKIGLTDNNVNFLSLSKPSKNILGPRIFSTEINDCIIGNYPDFPNALNKIRGGVESIAFSRRFAIKGGSLMFKYEKAPIGIAERAGPVLFDAFQYLEEVLEEDLNG